MTYGNIAFAPVNCFGYDVLYMLQKNGHGINKRNFFSYGQFDDCIPDEDAHEMLLDCLENYKAIFNENTEYEYISQFRTMKNWIKAKSVPFYNHYQSKHGLNPIVYSKLLSEADSFNVDAFTLYSNYAISEEYQKRLLSSLRALSGKQTPKLIVFSNSEMPAVDGVEYIQLMEKIYFTGWCPESIKASSSDRDAWWFLKKEDIERISNYFKVQQENLSTSHFSTF